MTKEEAFDLIRQKYPSIRNGVFLTENEMIDLVLMGQQPSLPEGLEEAAREFSRGQNYPAHAYAGFKAGAEWMAGQGVTSVAEVDDYIGLLTREYPCGCSCVHGVFVETHGKIGDKVIVQIRKK